MQDSHALSCTGEQQLRMTAALRDVWLTLLCMLCYALGYGATVTALLLRFAVE
jgi:hypothetical protein